ncbi:hypothetical protein FRC03_006423 [Tulasnella sp. 419]|nr:hypothetical protein FRC03_006423 [Tulasnella sp. 419]
MYQNQASRYHKVAVRAEAQYKALEEEYDRTPEEDKRKAIREAMSDYRSECGIQVVGGSNGFKAGSSEYRVNEDDYASTSQHD